MYADAVSRGKKEFRRPLGLSAPLASDPAGTHRASAEPMKPNAALRSSGEARPLVTGGGVVWDRQSLSDMALIPSGKLRVSGARRTVLGAFWACSG